jgi:hypothetical protein
VSLARLFALAVVATLLRVAVFFTASATGHLSIDAYTNKADGASYIAYAAAISGERSFNSLDEYDRRVFPGYPAMIAVVRCGIPLAIAALLVTWTSAGLATAAAASLFADVRVGYAMVCLIPHYLINSSLAMSEAPLLAVVLSGLLLMKKDKPWLAGLVLGFSILIRPMACFAIAGVLLVALVNRRWKSGAILATVSLVVFAAGILILQRWTGDALQGVRIYAHHPGAYGGRLFLWPFQSLITTPFHEPTTVGRITYTWIHVIITLSACVIVTWRVVGNKADRDLLSFPWLVGNTLLVLCIGSSWGFRHFPRFTIPAEPAMFWVLRDWLPSNRVVWLLIGTICFAAAVIGVRTSP